MSDDVGESCDELMRKLGGQIEDFSVAKRAQLPNLPDRRYFLRGIAFWAELKSPPIRGGDDRRVGDKLTRRQLDFLKREYDHGQIVFAGDRTMLLSMLQHPSADWRRIGYENVAIILSRGFRKERAA